VQAIKVVVDAVLATFEAGNSEPSS
jgi:hypothetical protein